MIIQGASFFDSVESKFIDNREIWIEKGYIQAIGQGFDKPGRDVVNLAGQLLLPGWIDAHVHLTLSGSKDPLGDYQKDGSIYTGIRAVCDYLPAHLQAGVTILRDLGGADDVVLQLRKAQQKKLVIGPTIFTAGQALTMTGGHIYQISREVDGDERCRRGARAELKKGVDLLKVIATGGIITPGVEPGVAQLSMEEIQSIVGEAKKVGRLVAAHAEGKEGIKDSLQAGVDTIEHGIGLDLQSIMVMKEKRVILIPTLSAPQLIIKHRAELPEEMVEKAEAMVEEHCRSFQLAHQHHVKIAVGTDAGTPFNEHGSFYLELEKLSEAGMSKEELLQAASLHGAMALGKEKEFGSIEPGKRAFMTIIDDRLGEKDWFRQIKMVMLDGKLHKIR